MSASTTTTAGVAAIACALIGSAAATRAILVLPDIAPEDRVAVYVGCAIALAPKFALFALGVLLLRRSSLALPLAIGTLAFSVIHSLHIYASGLPPIPEHLTEAGRAGKMFGRALGLTLPPILYLLLLAYLSLPRTRAEFSHSRERSPQRAVLIPPPGA